MTVNGRLTLFAKIVLLIVLIMAPLVLFFAYSSEKSIRVVQRELEYSTLHQLNLLLHQVEHNVGQLSGSSDMLLSDGDKAIERLSVSILKLDSYDRMRNRSLLQNKIKLQKLSGVRLQNELAVYLPGMKEVVTTYPSYYDFDNDGQAFRWEDYSRFEVGNSGSPGWSYLTARSDASRHFVRYLVSPISAYGNLSSAKVIVEQSFSAASLIGMLGGVKNDGRGEPFFFHSVYGPIADPDADAGFIGQIASEMQTMQLRESGEFKSVLGGEKYLVTYMKSPSLNWYLVDYVPLQKILTPIRFTRVQFYMFTCLVLLLGFFAALLQYRNVQLPIKRLIHSINLFRKGYYSVRLGREPRNEFDILYTGFNQMADEIQQLIEKVYLEELNNREATLKQLQSQINPHFLYNCLFFIKNKAKLGEQEAVVAMALTLGNYFRFTTRVEKQTISLSEEIECIRNYLIIQNLRNSRFAYSIILPDELLDTEVPRLIVQPIVENAVVHGLEMKKGQGEILVRGGMKDDLVWIAVEDNGAGVTDEQLESLRLRLAQPMSEKTGCGIWNVHQRLKLKYGDRAGLELQHSELGGLKATLAFLRVPEP